MKLTPDQLNEIFNVYHNEYISYVASFYPEALHENPEAFLMLKPELVDLFLIIDDGDVFDFHKNLYFMQGSGKRKIVNISPDKSRESLAFEDEDKFVEDYLANEFNTGKIIYHDSSINSALSLFNNFDKVLERIKGPAEISMKLLSKFHGKSFIKHIDKKSSYYAQDAYKYIYSDLDFTKLLSTANNPNFEYALNESLASYENSLYLAATATAGTAMETLIITILEHANIDYEVHSSTELGYLVGQLLKNDIIDKKMKQRIMNAASLRNLASHANKGKTIREDARLVYQTIMTLGELYFQI